MMMLSSSAVAEAALVIGAMMLMMVTQIVTLPLLEGQLTIAKSVSVNVNDGAKSSGAAAEAPEHRALVPSDLDSGSSHVSVQKISIAADVPPKEPDTYRLETEGIPSKILSVYDNSQNKIGSSFVHPRPIVDTIQEHEKYGNTGDKFYPIGRAIVNGFEGFSNILNKLLDAPIEIAKTVSRSLTGTLNAIGGKIVGL